MTTTNPTLYGPGRTKQADAIRNLLQKTSVLQEGDYNFRDNSAWLTTASRDFLTAAPDLEYRSKVSTLDQDMAPQLRADVKTGDTEYASSVGITTAAPDLEYRSKVSTLDQFDHHFKFDHTNDTIPDSAYRLSATKGDFDQKHAQKVKMLETDRTVNWPDMAPQLRADVKTGDTEYASSVGITTDGLKGPDFPRLNATKASAHTGSRPQGPQKSVHFRLGTEDAGFLSENQRVYGRVTSATRRAELDRLAGTVNDAVERSRRMKTDGTASHVFRDGDYNGIAGDFTSTNTIGYGPRTKPIGLLDDQASPKSSGARESCDGSSNKLTEFARQHTVPEVVKEGKRGRAYQEGVHFQLGADSGDMASVYHKDFVSGSSGLRPPQTAVPPSANNVIQFDPDYAPTGTSCAQVDFLYQPGEPGKMATFGMTNDLNDNIILSHDETRHAIDRQASLAHESYRSPPAWFRSLAPRHAPRQPWDILQADPALPYSTGDRENSENKDNFFGAFMYGSNACERRLDSKTQCQERVSEGKASHFNIGQGESDTHTETKLQFTGAPKNDADVRPAGKTEIISKSDFAHIDSSANTLDMTANDAYKPSIGEPVTRWNKYQRQPSEGAFDTSVMKSDFRPVGQRTFTDSQQMRIEQCGRLPREWARSHLFHTDHTGNNQLISTAMMDFVKPEIMPGPKRLAAL